MTPRIDIDADLVAHYIFELAKYGAHGETGVWRTVYSPEWVAAQNQVAAWCDEAGLSVRWDAVGNVWGRLEGTEPGKSIVSGSHIDSQVPGGRYDGALGVLSAIIAIKTLKERFGTPRRSLEVLSFCEEEASRFPATNFWGSRAITGTIQPHEPHEIRGHDGSTIAEAMQAVGLNADDIPQAYCDDIETFIELHIEQGPILEQEGLAVGIVQGIPGLRHYVVELVGRADHAGGVPMDLRLDPMAGAAEIISGVIDTAVARGRPTVTTVGRMFVEPNLIAAVPDKVTFTIDARHPESDTVRQLYAEHEARIQSVAERRQLKARWHVDVDHAPCRSDPGVVTLIERAAEEQGIAALPMYSGGGHDTQRMANIAKVAMIFVRSRRGRSHTPAEYTSVPDAVAGIQLLAASLHKLAY